jgi:hypothetical protein
MPEPLRIKDKILIVSFWLDARPSLCGGSSTSSSQLTSLDNCTHSTGNSIAKEGLVVLIQ